MTSQFTEHNGWSDHGRAETLATVLPGEKEQPQPALTLAELRAEAERLISGMGRPVRRVSLRAGANAVEVDWEASAAPVAPGAAESAPAAAAPTAPATGAAAPEPPRPQAAGDHPVTAPLVGTVYLAPEPGAPPFVQVGDKVSAGQQLAIIEAMKLMNPILAERGGTVARVHAVDGEMAEFGEVLFELSDDDKSGD